MYAYTTTGTADFLEKLMSRHPEIDCRFMSGDNTTLVYYEDTAAKSIFESGKSYQILYEYKPIWNYGFVVAEHIPVIVETTPVFEGNFSSQHAALENTPTLLSARLLKESNSNQYVFLTQWQSEVEYTAWKQEQEEKQSFFAHKTRLSTYFANRPFTSTYHLLIDEDE